MDECYICKFCGKVCKNANSLRNHERLCKENPEKQESSWIKFNRESGAWNKGLTKETDERVRKYGETCSQRIQTGIIPKSFKGKHHTDAHKQRMRELAFERQLGGWHTSKRIEYKRH